MTVRFVAPENYTPIPDDDHVFYVRLRVSDTGFWEPYDTTRHAQRASDWLHSAWPGELRLVLWFRGPYDSMWPVWDQWGQGYTSTPHDFTVCEVTPW